MTISIKEANLIKGVLQNLVDKLEAKFPVKITLKDRDITEQLFTGAFTFTLDVASIKADGTVVKPVDPVKQAFEWNVAGNPVVLPTDFGLTICFNARLFVINGYKHANRKYPLIALNGVRSYKLPLNDTVIESIRAARRTRDSAESVKADSIRASQYQERAEELAETANFS